MNGTIASSTVTVAIVSFCRCGFVTRIRISPGLNSTRRMSNWSAGGGARPTRSSSVVPLAAKTATGRRAAAAARAPTAASRAGASAARRVHQSTTSKNPIQPSSVNSDWWAWNMNRPVWAKSISMIPRWPWQSITVSVYSKWSLEPVG